jgi:tetratricopeptide (TPR) repeat protein
MPNRPPVLPLTPPWARLAAFIAPVALALGMVGCMHPAPAVFPMDSLLADARFAPASVPEPSELFALTPAMRSFANNELRSAVRRHGPELGLVHALNHGGKVLLDYDSSSTRTAAQAFEARSGNCLSLVLLTAALAKDMGLSVYYQQVVTQDIWTFSDQLAVLNGHVNISLARSPRHSLPREVSRYTIDFIPITEGQRTRAKSLDEPTLVAMFYNNRAVEALGAGQLDTAYAAARVGLRVAPHHANLLNTLALIYRRHGDLALAEQVLRQLLAQDANNHHAQANLALVLQGLNRHAEASALQASLPPSPFFAYERGMQFAAESRWADAVQALHFQLARAYWQLGDAQHARRHLLEAQQLAPTPGLRQRYSAKLDALKRAG